MRCRFALLPLFIAVTGLSVGCHQSNTQGPLTPIGPFSGTTQLSPVQRTSAIGPMGGSTRVPPPGTGTYAVPNNYMGGSALGQAAYGQNNAGGFASSNSIGMGVQPTGWTQTNSDLRANSELRASQQNFSPSASLDTQAANAPMNMQSTSPLTSNLGGMRVIDLTNTPPPPGYQPQHNGAYNNTYAGAYPNAATAYPNPNTGDYPSNSNPNNYPASPNGIVPSSNLSPTNNFAPNGVAPANYLPGFGPQSGVPISGLAPQGSSFRPANEPMANQPMVGQPAQIIAQAPVHNREYPLTINPLEPSWNGVTKYENKTPSTAPISSPITGPTTGQDDLLWRRPAMR